MEDSYGSLALTSEYINDQALPKEVCRATGSALAVQILRSMYLSQLHAAPKRRGALVSQTQRHPGPACGLGVCVALTP